MAKLIISAVVAFLLLSNAYAADEVKTAPVVAASSAPELPSLGDEPKQQDTKPGFLAKAFVAVGIAVATYYLINDDSDDYNTSVAPSTQPGAVSQALGN